MGGCWAHRARLGLSADYLILVARNLASVHGSWWERDWDTGWVSRTVTAASKLHHDSALDFHTFSSRTLTLSSAKNYGILKVQAVLKVMC